MLVLGLVLLGLCLAATQARAEGTPAPAWRILAVTGPTNLPPTQSEIQRVTVGGTEGSFTLAHSLSEGKGTLDYGAGLFPEFEEGSDVVTFFFAEETESFRVGQEVIESEGALPPGAVIEAVDTAAGTVTVSKPALATTFAFELRAATKELTNVSGTFHTGDELIGEGLAPGTTVTGVGEGTLTISEYPTAGGRKTISTPEVTTAPLRYDATAAEVQAALEALPGYEAGTFSVTGGPGGEGGAPFFISFGGSLGDQDVKEFTAVGNSLGDGQRTRTRLWISDWPPAGT